MSGACGENRQAMAHQGLVPAVKAQPQLATGGEERSVETSDKPRHDPGPLRAWSARANRCGAMRGSSDPYRGPPASLTKACSVCDVVDDDEHWRTSVDCRVVEQICPRPALAGAVHRYRSLDRGENLQEACLAIRVVCGGHGGTAFRCCAG